MALISCPACEKRVSSRAPTCPQCGHPIATVPVPRTAVVRQPNSSIAGWMVVLVLILAIAGGIAFIRSQNNADEKSKASGSGSSGLTTPINAESGTGASAGFVAPAKPKKKDIVGRWDVVRSGTKTGSDVAGYMRFNKDGTFTSTLAFLATTDGKYKVLSSAAVELDFPGLIYGRNSVEFKYTVNEDSLTLVASTHSLDLAFKSVDSGE